MIEPIEIPFGMCSQMGSRNRVLCGGSLGTEHFGGASLGLYSRYSKRHLMRLFTAADTVATCCVCCRLRTAYTSFHPATSHNNTCRR